MASLRSDENPGRAPVPAAGAREGTGRHFATLLIDTPPHARRHTADLVAAGAMVLATLLVLALVGWAPATMRSVAVDVRSAGSPVRDLLLVAPQNVLAAVVTFAIPLTVVIWLLQRAGLRPAVHAALTLATAAPAMMAVRIALEQWSDPTLAAGLSVPGPEGLVVVITPFIAALSAMLTLASGYGSARVYRWSWWLLGIVVALTVLRHGMALPAAVITVLLGCALGFLSRFIAGTTDDRTTGIALVLALRRAGIDATRIARVSPELEARTTRSWLIEGSRGLGHEERVRERPRLAQDDAVLPLVRRRRVCMREVPLESADISFDLTSCLGFPDAGALSRRFRVHCRDGAVVEALFLDVAHPSAGAVRRWWGARGWRGLTRPPARTPREAAERAVAASAGAKDAGLPAAAVLGTTATAGSAVVVLAPSARLRPLANGAVTDTALDSLWRQLRAAHQAGLAHQHLSIDALAADPEEGTARIVGWHAGSVASSELARRMDLARLLTVQAQVAGPQRAIASASRTLPTTTLSALVPLLQPLAIPGPRARTAGLLSDLRRRLVAQVPEADAEPAQLRRFSLMSVLGAVVLVGLLAAVVTSLDAAAVAEAVRSAHLPWLVAAFAAGLLTYLGGGLTLVALVPDRTIALPTATAVQLAARVVSLVAPAGIGPAAVNLRYLHRHGIPLAVALATVTLAQACQFLVTVAALVAVAAISGATGSLGVPSGAVIWAGIGLALAVAIAALIPALRRWVVRTAGPALRQAWPRMVWLSGQPGRLAIAVLGSLVMSAGFIAAFGFSLAAFGHSLPLAQLAMTYMVSSTAGSVIPTPGGIGPVEAALTGGLTVAGIPLAIAVSAAVLFRLVTFWLPVPLGWAALRLLHRRGAL